MNQSFTCGVSTKAVKYDSFSEDDSLFNESVIQSTQAIEEALFDKDKNKFVSPADFKAALSKVKILRRDEKSINPCKTTNILSLVNRECYTKLLEDDKLVVNIDSSNKSSRKSVTLKAINSLSVAPDESVQIRQENTSVQAPTKTRPFTSKIIASPWTTKTKSEGSRYSCVKREFGCNGSERTTDGNNPSVGNRLLSNTSQQDVSRPHASQPATTQHCHVLRGGATAQDASQHVLAYCGELHSLPSTVSAYST